LFSPKSSGTSTSSGPNSLFSLLSGFLEDIDEAISTGESSSRPSLLFGSTIFFPCLWIL